jgi:hypothetical protein
VTLVRARFGSRRARIGSRSEAFCAGFGLVGTQATVATSAISISTDTPRTGPAS